MKQVLKIMLTAASLLSTGSMLLRTPINVKAASNVSTTNSLNSDNLYFLFNGQKLADNAVLPMGKGVAVSNGDSLEKVLTTAKSLVSLSMPNVQITTNVSELRGQVQSQNVLLDNSNNIAQIPSAGFYVTLTARNNGQVVNVRVPFGNAYTVTQNAPEVQVSFEQNNATQKLNVNNLIFQITSGSKFHPLNFVGSNKVQFKLSASNNGTLTVDSDTVDPSQPGSLGQFKVTATNSQGQKSTSSFEVYVMPQGMQRLGVDIWTDSYRISDGRVWKNEQLNRGDAIYAGNDTQIINKVSYTRISTKSQEDANSSSNNTWIKTSDLVHKNVDAVTKRVMHEALIYDSIGGSKLRKIPAFKLMTFEKKIYVIKNVKYYKVINAPDYIKAANVDGTKRTLKKNAYIYATSNRRANKNVLRKGTKITTYGSSYKFKNGKRYYRIEGATKTQKRYVRVTNFK